MTHFINKSSEVIPPFACMQIAIPPDRWAEADRLQLTDTAKQLFINGGESNPDEHPRYDQDTVLYCIKPNLVSAIMQEPLSMAFNGDSYVAPNQQGFCTVGQAPARAIAGKAHYGYSGLLVMPDSWRLSYGAIEYSAFKGLYSTTHETGGPRATSGVGSSFNNVVFVGPNTFRQLQFPLTGDGRFFTFAEGDNEFSNTLFFGDSPFRFISGNDPYFQLVGSPLGSQVGLTDPFVSDDPIPWFDKGRLELPGIYFLRIVGRLRANVSDPEIAALPITLRVKLVPDSPITVSDTIQGDTLAITVQRYVTQTVPEIEYAWPIVGFEMNMYIRFIGTKGKLVLENLSSPFVEIERDTTFKYLLTRLQFLQYFQNEIQRFGSDVWGASRPDVGVGAQFYVPYATGSLDAHRVIFYPDE